MVIAVDFDGTIVEHAYPAIGKELPFAFYTLRKLQEEGHQLILWTFRSGKELDEAVEFCRKHGIEFYAVNKNYPEEVWDDSLNRKIIADIYIDDRNLGGFPGWGEAYQIIKGIQKPEDDYSNKFKKQKKTSFLNRIFKRLIE